MRRDLNPGDLGDLLEQPLLATLATRRRDGSTLLSPVWHEWQGDAFLVAIPQGDVKAAQIERDPRVSILLAEGSLPYRGIEISGDAVRSTDPYGAVMRRLAVRYFGPGADALYPDTAEGVVLRIAPGRMRCWDFMDDMAALAGGDG